MVGMAVGLKMMKSEESFSVMTHPIDGDPSTERFFPGQCIQKKTNQGGVNH